MMLDRGQLNIAAGDHAAQIVKEIHALVPNPPQGAIFVVRDVPSMDTPAIPPGNDGAYLFNNGLPAAIHFEYGRSDLTVIVGRDGSALAPAGAFLIDIRGYSVVLLP